VWINYYILWISRRYAVDICVTWRVLGRAIRRQLAGSKGRPVVEGNEVARGRRIAILLDTAAGLVLLARPVGGGGAAPSERDDMATLFTELPRETV
jgi:hypothetical protein